MSAPAVRVEVRPDAVAVLTIDQPDSKLNILTDALWTDLEAAVDSLAARTDVKGLVVASGKPGVFIAGADIKVFATAPGPNDPTVRAFIEHGLRVLEKLAALPVPTCAAIDGAALGGGLEVSLACDYRVVGTNPKAQLGLPEVKLGLIPGWGGTQRLPRVIGLFEATAMVTSGRTDPGAGAAVSGLADRVVDSPRLMDECLAVVLGADERERKTGPVTESEFSTHPPTATDSVAAEEAVRVMTEGAALPLAAGIELETEAFLRLAGSPESKRLIAEFFDSRKK